MREIKFRAWEKYGGFMIHFNINFIDDSPCYKDSLMQYTGLKDKNAYESDIIRDNIGVGVIEYVEKYAAFRVNYINDRCKWFYDYLDSEFKSLKVIGNIYENPELLKGE